MGNNVKRRIRHLRDTAAAYPTQRANIEAIMRYYEGGGRLPVPGREVLYSFDGEAKMGSLNDFVNEHVARGTVGWYDVRRASFRLWFPFICRRLTMVPSRSTWPRQWGIYLPSKQGASLRSGRHGVATAIDCPCECGAGPEPDGLRSPFGVGAPPKDPANSGQ